MITGCVSMSAITLLGITLLVPIGITSFEVGLNITALTAWIKRYKSIIKKQKKEHDKIVLLGKSKLDTIEALFSKDLIDWHIIHNVWGKYNEIKEEIENPENSVEYTIWINRYQYERNDFLVETIVDNDGILWLNE